MKLGIISDCTHYRMPDGSVATENHILLRQFLALASYFSKTVISCPFAEYNSTKVLSVYPGGSITFYELPMVGGDTLQAKAKLLSAIPAWYRAFKFIDKNSDIVYQRFPNNLNIPGFFYFLLRQKKTFATYTGTWGSHVGEPATYRFQRWLLSRFFKGPVWVYTSQEKKLGRIIPGFSPSYSASVWEQETEQVEQRIQKFATGKIDTYKLISVGSLAPHKNHSSIIKACVILLQQGFSFRLTIVGDGVLRNKLEQLIKNNGLQHHVQLVGKKNADELRELYRQSDFVVQAPTAEGFGKVPIEAFFHGVIPVINNVSMALLITGNGERGFLFEGGDPKNIAQALLNLKFKTELLPHMIMKGRAYAKTQTLEAWASEYYQTVKAYFEKA